VILFALIYNLKTWLNLYAFSMASRGRGNCNWSPEGPSYSHQQEPDVPRQLNHCKLPTDEPADATTLWINQLKYIWGLCRLSIKWLCYKVHCEIFLYRGVISFGSLYVIVISSNGV
jgi:hypothetical protein